MRKPLDVLVIGGGPAGLITAIAAAKAGFSVEIAEPQSGLQNLPIDKCCGEGLMPAAVSALEHLGVVLPEEPCGSMALRGIRFIAGTSAAEALFQRDARSLGVRRTVLHAGLHRRAEKLGVRWNVASARLLDPAGPVVSLGVEERMPRWVVGADGMQSAVRTAAGLDAGALRSQRFGVRQHFQLKPWTDAVEVYWAQGAQAYVTPVDQNTVGVAAISQERFSGGFIEALRLFPALAERLGDAQAVSRERGAVTGIRTLPRVSRGRVLLVGDASGCVDAITGDGVSLAAMQALALVEAIRTDNTDGYERKHRQIMRRARLMSHVLVGVGSHPVISAASVRLLRTLPGLFPALLRFHADIPRMS